MKNIVWLILCLALVPTVSAGPLYDPFMEEFQVGAHTNPDQLDMAGLWPGGLLTMPEVDPSWAQAAEELLGSPDDHLDTVTHRFLARLATNPFGSVSVMFQAVALLNEKEGSAAPVESRYLLRERMALAAFGQLERGNPGLGRELVHDLLNSSQVQLRERERFVWRMRELQMKQLAGDQVAALALPWLAESRLGPYDRTAVWALWVAHRRAAQLPLIPSTWNSKQEATRLAGLRQANITPAALEASSFSSDLKAGLGGTWFDKDDLAAHLKKYPLPPQDFSAQGWWVKGNRFSQRGNSRHYESLARRGDLKPGWRMDVWRRTSEIHLLAGRWDKGLAALDEALAIAARDGGTRGLRRRLRHWVEQAAVLALANDRQETAWQLLDKGAATFTGEAGRVFQDEIRHWQEIRTGETSYPEDLIGQVERKVAAGLADDLGPALGPETENKAKLKAGAARTPWDLWFRWGQALADPEPLSGDRRQRAISYAQYLGQGLAAADNRGQEDAALLAIAHRFQGRDDLLVPLLNKIVDRDICRLASWQTSPMPSPVPTLLPALRQSQLDMHAALGVALATGDMRGIIAIAYELPGQGLTPDEKRRFLYPLPADGPILGALLSARSEPSLILAVARNESLFEPAVRSRAGALGWMQIMPFHFANRGALPGAKNWAVPAVSIGLGDGLLQENRRRYEGDPYLTLAAYNAGPGAASRWRKQLGGSLAKDIYLAWIGYPETRNYVEKVLIDREIYDWILNGQP